jgi:hypothetical protein
MTVKPTGTPIASNLHIEISPLIFKSPQEKCKITGQLNMPRTKKNDFPALKFKAEKISNRIGFYFKFLVIHKSLN